MYELKCIIIVQEVPEIFNSTSKFPANLNMKGVSFLTHPVCIFDMPQCFIPTNIDTFGQESIVIEFSSKFCQPRMSVLNAISMLLLKAFFVECTLGKWIMLSH